MSRRYLCLAVAFTCNACGLAIGDFEDLKARDNHAGAAGLGSAPRDDGGVTDPGGGGAPDMQDGGAGAGVEITGVSMEIGDFVTLGSPSVRSGSIQISGRLSWCESSMAP